MPGFLLAILLLADVSRERLQPSKPTLVVHPVDQTIERREVETLFPKVPPVHRNFPPGPPPPPPPANGCGWQFVGPTNIHGRVLDIAIEPGNGQHLYLATVGGVWRSMDRARRWERVSDDFASGVFGSVAVNPSTPSEVFAGGGEANQIFQPQSGNIGIWVSSNFGAVGSWTKSSPPLLDAAIVFRMQVAPNGDVYAATSLGVWRGVHSGGSMTWTQLGNFDAWTSDLVLEPAGNSVAVWAGVQVASASFVRGIWRWDGSSWTAKNGTGPSNIIDFSNTRTIRLAISKSSPKRLYARVESMNNAALQGLYRTDDSGVNWIDPGDAVTTIGVGCAAGYNVSLGVDPTDPDTVYSGCLTIFRSKNAGGHFEAVDGGADPAWVYNVHVDQHAVAFDPQNPKIVYLGHDGGVDRSTDTSNAVWHWTDVSHGLTNWQLYRTTVHEATPTLAGAGAQDTGNAFTLGNRAWYLQWFCDGYSDAFSAGNPLAFYIGCGGPQVQLRANPIPGTASFASGPLLVPKVFIPFVTDPDVPFGALSQTDPGCQGGNIVKSTDGVHFSPIETPPAGWTTEVLHSVRGSNFQRYYAGLTDGCISGFNVSSQIWTTTNGGSNWTKTQAGLPPGRIQAFAGDPANVQRGFAVFPTSVVMTTDGGTVWTPIDGSGATALPAAALRWSVALDPADANLVYVATDAGVFAGVVNGATATWTPFNEGLAVTPDVRDISVNAKDHSLTIGTWGYGVWRRNIGANQTCPDRRLVIRDNVLDRGTEPSPFNVPDPENPVPDPAHAGFFKPDDSPGGRLYWWTSNDIRVDVPDADPVANQLASVDHDELETCPIAALDCPAGTMIDSSARRTKPARVYVQMTNGGFKPVSNVRVMALWTDATTTVADLPANFWTATFPASGPCGQLAPGSPWHLVDTAKPCHTVAQINPAMPEVARFDWDVPQSAAQHTCMLTISESDDDPLNPNVRAQNLVSVSKIVQQNHQIAQRNLHVVNANGLKKWMLAEPLLVFNPTKEDAIDLLFDQQVKIVTTQKIPDARPAELTPEERRALASDLRDERHFVYSVKGRVRFAVRAGQTARIFLAASGEGRRVLNVVAMTGERVLGGSRYVMRTK